MRINPLLLIVLAVAGTLSAVWLLRPEPVPVTSSALDATAAAPEKKTIIPVSLTVMPGAGAAITAEGQVWVWGSGEIDNRDIGPDELMSARLLKGLTGVRALALGSAHTLAIRHDGNVWATGNNSGGQLGTRIPDGRLLARDWIAVPGLGQSAQVLVTVPLSLALREDGTVWGWGMNGWGRMGPDYPRPIAAAPVQLPGLQGIRSLALDESSEIYFALHKDGRVLAWGSLPEPGRVDKKDIMIPVSNPLILDGIEQVQAISASQSWLRQLLVLRQDGSVALWSPDRLGEHCQSLPIVMELPDMTGAASIAMGASNAFAVKADGSFWTWEPGEGCTGATRQLLPPGSASQVAVYQTAYALLLQDGQVLTWGNSASHLPRTGTGNSQRSWEQRERVLGLGAESAP